MRHVQPPVWVAYCIAAWLGHLHLPSESQISPHFNSLAAPLKPFWGRISYSSLSANRGVEREKKKHFSDAASPSSLVPHSWGGGNLDTLLTSLRRKLGEIPTGICSSVQAGDPSGLSYLCLWEGKENVPYLCRETKGEGTAKLRPPFCVPLGHQDTSGAGKVVQMSEAEANGHEMVLEATGEIESGK